MTFRFYRSLFLFMSAVQMAYAEDAKTPNEDQYLWLEERSSERSIAWVKDQSEKTLGRLKADPNFEQFYTAASGILNANDRIPAVQMLGDYLYNFWQDKDHVRGILRRTTISEFKKAEPSWELVLDIDQLAKDEKENLFYHSIQCLQPAAEHCLITLSVGGGDAQIIREFSTTTKSFVEGGFALPLEKSDVLWVDKDTLLVGTKFDENSMTKSGYPRTSRVWRRGQPLQDAKEIFAGAYEDTSVRARRYETLTSQATIIERAVSFFETEYFFVDKQYQTKKIDLPLASNMMSAFGNDILVHLKVEWALGTKVFPQGSVVAIDMDNPSAEPELVFAPNAQESIVNVAASAEAIYISMLDNVNGKILSLKKGEGGWTSKVVSSVAKGSTAVKAVSHFLTDVLYSVETFTQPPQVNYIKTSDTEPEVIKTSPARFDGSAFDVEQKFTISKDGTKVPYFIVKPKGLVLDGKNATLLYGYGGFELSMTPSYLPVQAHLWLNKGGVYVLANIRGGGEFGPGWHNAAILEKRQNAYDDFIAIAEDLIATKVTSPARLGIMGGSNGGLLVGAVTMQRPDLFSAVVCTVPLLDMIRYPKLPAGHSWVGEYGDPEDPNMREVILKYSPYQTIRENVAYPEIFFFTSTLDDRVHPGHARKMAHKLIDHGQSVVFFENVEGGHAGSTNLNQRAFKSALEYTYLWQKLR